MSQKSFVRRSAGWSLAVAAGLVVLGGCRGAEPAPVATEPPTPVPAGEQMVVALAPVADSVRAPGVVEAKYDATLSAKATGRVRSVLVREGDVVRKGQLLVEIDDEDLGAAEEMAVANVRAAQAGLARAETAAAMEIRTSQARVEQAAAAVKQAQAAVAAARARRSQADTGLRDQEKAQARLAVQEAESARQLAERELDRRRRLVEMGAIAQRELDVAQNQFDSAKARHAIAQESLRLAEEGTRSEERLAAAEAVRLAESALTQAQAGLAEAEAARMGVRLRRDEANAARAQVGQATAAQRMAGVARAQTRVVAPFDGVVRARMVDPGALAAPGTPLVAIQGGGLRLRASVPESIAVGLKVGDAATAGVDGARTRVSAPIVEIIPAATPGAHTVDVRFDLLDLPSAKPGMFGSVELARAKQERIVVPESVIGRREGLAYVRAVDAEGLPHLRLVTLGRTLPDGRVEVVAGLRAGDRIDRRGPFPAAVAGR